MKKVIPFIIIITLFLWDSLLGRVSLYFGSSSGEFYLSYTELVHLKYISEETVLSLRKLADYYGYWKADSETYYLFIRRLAKKGETNSQYMWGKRQINNGQIASGIEWISKSADGGEEQACLFINRRVDLNIKLPDKCK